MLDKGLPLMTAGTRGLHVSTEPQQVFPVVRLHPPQRLEVAFEAQQLLRTRARRSLRGLT